MHLGERLRLFITMSGLTVQAFAQKCGIPRRTIHEYLRGERKPAADQLARMIEVGVDVEWLLTGRVPARIIFDFSTIGNLTPIEGIVAADPELSRELLKFSLEVVDEFLGKNPDAIKTMGMIGAIASVWSIFQMASSIAERFSEQFQQARAKGLATQALAAMVAEPIRPEVLRRLSVGKLEQMQG